MNASAKNQFMPLQLAKHGHLKLKRETSDYSFARNTLTVAVTVNELPSACSEYPCVIARQHSGALGLLAVTGLQAGNNLFVDDDGTWLGQYLPNALNTRMNDSLLDAQGQPSPWLTERLHTVTETEAGMTATTRQLNQLEAAGVFTDEALLAILPDGCDLASHGFLTVDEDRLQALSENTIYELHTSGALQLAYWHLLSMRQLHKLVMRSAEQTKPITTLADTDDPCIAGLPIYMLPD